MTQATPHLLEVQNLKTYFHMPYGVVKAVNDVSFYIDAGEVLGLVGESGCGKSVTALSIMRLVASPPGRVVAGSIRLNGEDLLQLSEKEMQGVRGRRVAMVFQEPMSSLNPVLTIERQLTEPLELHLSMTRRQAFRRAEELLEMVGISDASERLRSYPHHLSGGMAQRVMIAMALSCNPELLIADEATTALDVTIQAQILELMRDLTSQFNTALIIITHNLGIIARYANRVNVMYAGKIRESGEAATIYATPKHPYTVGLLNTVPQLDSPLNLRLDPIEGEIPDMTDLPEGCAFRPRCPWGWDRCENEEPPLMEAGTDHLTACWEHPRVERKGITA